MSGKKRNSEVVDPVTNTEEKTIKLTNEVPPPSKKLIDGIVYGQYNGNHVMMQRHAREIDVRLCHEWKKTNHLPMVYTIGRDDDANTCIVMEQLESFEFHESLIPKYFEAAKALVDISGTMTGVCIEDSSVMMRIPTKTIVFVSPWIT